MESETCSSFPMLFTRAHLLGIFILVGVCLHIPYDLMCEKLRKFGSLYYISRNIPQSIISKSLYNLWYVEERDVDSMALYGSHTVLYNKGMIVVRRKEVGDGRDWIYWGPVQQILDSVNVAHELIPLWVTFSWNETSAGSEEPKSTCSASGSSIALSG